MLPGTLEELVDITRSESALLAETVAEPGETLFGRLHFVVSRGELRTGLLPENTIFSCGKTLIGRLLCNGKLVMAEGSPLRQTGLPKGHTPVHSFVGIPIALGTALIGFVVLVNRPRAYNLKLVTQLRPLLDQIAYLCSLCIEQRRASESAETIRQAGERYFEPLAWTDTAGTVQAWNKKAEDVFGLPRREAMGKKLEEVLGAELDIPSMVPCVTAHGYWTKRLTMRGLSKETPVEVHAVRQPKPYTGLTWIIRNISAQVAAEKSAQEAADRFNALVQNTRTGFWMAAFDATTNVYTSPAITSILGLPPSDIDFSTWKALVHPEDRVEMDAIKTVVLAGGSWRYKYRIIRPNSKVRWVESYVFPVRDAEGKPYCMAGLTEDITEREELEASLRAALQEKDALLREIHHRVKNNLQLISSLLRLQSRATADAGAAGVLHESLNRIDAIALLHEHLHKFDTQGKIHFDTYARRLVSNIFRMNGYPPTERHLRFDLAPFVMDSETALRCGLILNELVTNALRHALPHGRTGLVWVRFRVTSTRALLSVQDDGIGLPRDFNPKTVSSLGIKLVQQLVKQLKGTVSFMTDGGTTVSVGFPRPTRSPPSNERRARARVLE